ncbi:hypothetical protein CI102_12165 [Trichoderma harzianum]|uniref:Uncharacterized protein n=1 Tax=Trichoderma harzianum CBS 226.95 TaxID=983964 RepID=A0A2T3ZRP9_TRIHA|nr:hypothetical protein M431DRAFT_514349 [Trichoderma harzianum CBS 226.95]PKK43242.1 hypothetical protein CI102_12165 [Trichoderma harzianum]PTB47496.1 hypothetical protein M431DRAFT_514349 [Trichoderma harzianum CBS 226.95]
MGKSRDNSRRSSLGEDAEGKQNLLYVILEEGSPIFLSRKVRWSGIFISAPGPDINLNASRGRALEKLKMSVHMLIDPNPGKVPHLIPAYSKESIAIAEARRRKKTTRGKRQPRIAVIDVNKIHSKAKHRHLRSLARQFGISIPRQNWDISEYQYVFSHYIPFCAVQDVYRV